MGISGRRPHLALTLAVLVCFGMAGCGPPVLETHSLEAIEESLAALRKPLDPETLGRFDESLAYLVGGATPADGIGNPALEGLVLEVYRPLKDSTAESIINGARAARAAEVNNAISKLESREEEAREARELLAELQLSSGRIFKINKGYLEWPMLEVKVENTSAHRIFVVKLRASLISPDDPKPWLVEEIDHLIYQGMEPGARDMWRIEPEQQEWIRFLDPHPELRFNVEVLKITTMAKEVVAETDFGAVEQHTLELYKKTRQRIRDTGELALDQPPRAELAAVS